MMYRKLALLAASCLLSVSAFATTYDDAVDATFKNDADALAPLLAKGLDPNTVTSSGAGEPLLMLAIRKNANSVIDLLLKQKNIKVDQPNTLKDPADDRNLPERQRRGEKVNCSRRRS